VLWGIFFRGRGVRIVLFLLSWCLDEESGVKKHELEAISEADASPARAMRLKGSEARPEIAENNI